MGFYTLGTLVDDREKEREGQVYLCAETRRRSPRGDVAAADDLPCSLD